jgi:hypothetical protein
MTRTRTAHWVAFSSSLLAFTIATAAHADFAGPPDQPDRRYDRYDPYPEPEPVPPLEPQTSRSTVRLEVGPALKLPNATPGLAAALNLGKRAVGGRITGAWLGAGTDEGVSSYSLELWVDFAGGAPLHPVVGTGAAFVQAQEGTQKSSLGAAVLRGALEYELPLADADARVGLSVTGLVPAIGGQAAPGVRRDPWVMGALTVSAGF